MTEPGATDDPSPLLQTPLVQPLIWIDLEMTGLDPDADLVVEIATIVTDGSLDRVVEGPELIIYAHDEVLDAMDPVVVAMHKSSGLTELVQASELSVADAERQTLEFLRKVVPEPGVAPLAGNSVHADRAFMRRHMPKLEAWMHYRNVDVSTFKESARRWDTGLLDRAPSKGGAHRALADIRESIAELRFYRNELFKPVETDTDEAEYSSD